MKIVLFGAGEMTMKFLEREDILQYDIQAVADNDKKKQGVEISCGNRCFKVISADKVVKYDFDIIIITIAKFCFQLDIVEQLANLGISRNRIKILRNGVLENVISILKLPQGSKDTNSLYFDTTHISVNDINTGIQRVVKELYRNMMDLEPKMCPVRYVKDTWITGKVFDCRIKSKPFDDIEYLLGSPSEKNVFLPDASWSYAGMLESLRDCMSVNLVLYDLIPIMYPEFCTEIHRREFAEWVQKGLQIASRCICISKFVADSLIDYYRERNIHREKVMEIHIMHLGFDIPAAKGEVRKEIKDFANDAITFLIVGTVEPRKNHRLLLESLKRVMHKIQGRKIQLLILGKDGWMNESFKEMYVSDKEIQNRVLWIEDASDSEVQWAYQHCAALVYPSKIEGFGLPLVEAAHFQLPILCSDIPIFREIVGEYADYFKVDDVDALSEALVRWISSDSHPDSGKVKMYTWKECASEVVDILNGNKEPYAVLR